jgi:steroid delta-isomerase-like uncharacterized protein
VRRLIVLVLVVASTLLVQAAPSRAQDASPAAGSLEANKQVVRGLYDAYNAQHWDALDTLIAADAVDHNAVPGQAPGLAGVKQQLMGFAAAFPGSVTIDDLVAQGDLVSDRIHLDGVNSGSFFGIPATGKTVRIDAVEIWRVKDGKIVEGWHVENIFGLLVQLGVMPAIGGSGTPAAGATESTMPAAAMATPISGSDPDANAAIVRRYFESGPALDRAQLAQIIAPDYLLHFFGFPNVHGIEGFLAIGTPFKAAFPDFACTTDVLVAEGDRVAAHWSCTGTQQGSFVGMPASGKSIVFSGISIVRLVDGKVAEDWTAADLFGLLLQLGAIPAPGGQATPVS